MSKTKDGKFSKIHRVRPIPSSLQPMGARIRNLFCLGDWTSIQWDQAVVIVGTRSLTDYGQTIVRELIPPLVAAGLVPVSLLGPGTGEVVLDLTVKNGGQAVALVSGGLLTINSSQDSDLGERVLASGGWLFSPFPSKSPRLSWTYRTTNELLARLGSLLVVIEAGEHSGCLEVVRLAVQAGKKVLAIPGRLTDPQSQGCNQLIRDGLATALLEPGQIFKALSLSSVDTKVAKKDTFSPNEKKILNSLKQGHASYDQLMVTTQLPAVELGVALTKLSLKGVIVESLGVYRIVK